MSVPKGALGWPRFPRTRRHGDGRDGRDQRGRQDRPRAHADVQTAAYSCIREELQNAAKHARGAAVDVCPGRDNGWLRFAARGGGMLLHRSWPGARRLGCPGMADRLAALGIIPTLPRREGTRAEDWRTRRQADWHASASVMAIRSAAAPRWRPESSVRRAGELAGCRSLGVADDHGFTGRTRDGPQGRLEDPQVGLADVRVHG